MGLFDFFKREKKVKFDINNSSLTELLDKGILFEDNGKFLKWGIPVKDLSKDVEVKEKLFADRTVYHWGKHSILNGLSLELTTTYWNHREDSVYKIFNSISFSIAGDNANKYLDVIKHTWKINLVRRLKISISFFQLQRFTPRLAICGCQDLIHTRHRAQDSRHCCNS